MANIALISQRLTCRLSSANELGTRMRAIAVSLRNCSSKKTCNCDCPHREAPKKDSRDTEEECEYYKKLMATKHTENSCRRDESKCHRPETVCDPMDCELKKIEESSHIPREIFQEEPPCMPFESKDCRNKCEIAELKKCYANNPRKAQCRSKKPTCYSWDKTYPMRDAGLKPEIDGRPIIGESWKRKSWGIKC